MYGSLTAIPCFLLRHGSPLRLLLQVAGRKIQTYAISVAAPKDAQLALVFAGSLPSRAVPDSKAAVVGIRAGISSRPFRPSLTCLLPTHPPMGFNPPNTCRFQGHDIHNGNAGHHHPHHHAHTHWEWGVMQTLPHWQYCVTLTTLYGIQRRRIFSVLGSWGALWEGLTMCLSRLVKRQLPYVCIAGLLIGD
jgi:hypothetical protein